VQQVERRATGGTTRPGGWLLVAVSTGANVGSGVRPSGPGFGVQAAIVKIPAASRIVTTKITQG
jgi:hypothetical protein